MELRLGTSVPPAVLCRKSDMPTSADPHRSPDASRGPGRPRSAGRGAAGRAASVRAGACATVGRGRDPGRGPGGLRRPARDDDPDGHAADQRVVRRRQHPPASGGPAARRLVGRDPVQLPAPDAESDGSVLTNSPRTPVAPTGTQAPPTTLAGTTYTVTANYVESLVNGVGQSDFCSAGQPPESEPSRRHRTQGARVLGSVHTALALDHHRHQLPQARPADRRIPGHQPDERAASPTSSATRRTPGSSRFP